MGGSSGGGGGGSGRVSYPAYMETAHGDWLNQGGTDVITDSITGFMNTAFAADPFSAALAYDPDTALADADTAICGFDTLVDTLAHDSDWIAAVSDAVTYIDGTILTGTWIADAVTAFEDVQEDLLNYKVLPEFESGMRDLNAVMSSTFVVGKSVLLGMHIRDVAKFNADLRFKMAIQRSDMVIKGVNQMLQSLTHRVDSEGTYASMKLEFNRMKIIAKSEEEEANTSYDEFSAKWDLEIFQYGSNLLAAIGGGVSSGPIPKKPSKAQSALAGAAAGASIGAMAGGPYGALIGAVVGAGAALLTS